MCSWLVGVSVGAVGGLVLVPLLASRGLAHLATPRRSRVLILAAGAAGAASGAVAFWAALRAGSWWWLPPLLAWAYTLSAAAVCDAWTQRIPTSLVWQGAATTALLLVAAGVATADWRGIIVSVAACASAGLVLAVCWRFAGAGFGDVRLAVLGGLGLGHSSHRSLALGVAAFIALTVCLAVWTFVRTSDRRVTFPYGPALAVGFLIAAGA